MNFNLLCQYQRIIDDQWVKRTFFHVCAYLDMSNLGCEIFGFFSSLQLSIAATSGRFSFFFCSISKKALFLWYTFGQNHHSTDDLKFTKIIIDKWNFNTTITSVEINYEQTKGVKWFEGILSMKKWTIQLCERFLSGKFCHGAKKMAWSFWSWTMTQSFTVNPR